MAENLCNNIKTKVSLEGRSFSDPCGWLGCNYSNLQDWLSTLKQRIDLAKANLKKLESLIQLPNVKNLNSSELQYSKRIADSKEIYDELVTKADNLSSSEYEKYIKQLLVAISETTCLIEEIQNSIEEDGREGRIVLTGLADQRQAGFGDTMFKWIFIGAAGYLAFTFVNSKIK